LSDVEIDAVAGGITFSDVLVSSAVELENVLITSAVGAVGKSDETGSRK